jgi:hypothetical protein
MAKGLPQESQRFDIVVTYFKDDMIQLGSDGKYVVKAKAIAAQVPDLKIKR